MYKQLDNLILFQLKRKILSPSPSPLITAKQEDSITTKRKKPSPLKDLDTLPKISKAIKPQAATTKSNLNMNALHDELASAVHALSVIQPERDIQPELKLEPIIPSISKVEPIKPEEKVISIKNRRLCEMATAFKKQKDDQFRKTPLFKKEVSFVDKLLDKIKNFKKIPPAKEPEVKDEDKKELQIKEEIDEEFLVEIKDPELLTLEEIAHIDSLIKKQKNENRKKPTAKAGFGDVLLDMPNKHKYTKIIDKIEKYLKIVAPEEITPMQLSPAVSVSLSSVTSIQPSIPMQLPSEDNFDSDSDSESRLVIEVNEPEEEKCKPSPILPSNPVDVAAKTAIQTIEENKDITIVRVEKKDLEQGIIQPPPPLLGMTTITPLVYPPISGSSSPSTGRIFGIPTALDFSDAGVKPIVDISQISQDLIIQEKKIVPMNPETSLHSLPAETSIRPYLKKDVEVHSDSSSNQHSDSMKMLLCEETIPGSPSPVVGKDIPADIKPLTSAILHPIESNLKSIPMDIESSMEVKHEISLTAINFNSPHESQDDSCEDIKARMDLDSDISPRKKRRGYTKVMMVNDDTPAKKKKISVSGKRGGKLCVL